MADRIVTARALAAARVNVKGGGKLERAKPGTDADQRPQDIDWNYWRALDLWPIDAACKLVCNADPNEPTRARDIQNPDTFTRPRWVNLFHQAMAVIWVGRFNIHGNCVVPAEFIAWAAQKGRAAPPELLVMAAEQGAPTLAEGHAKVERRAHDKRATEDRYCEWQEAIDKLAQESPDKSHVDYCRTLSKQIHVPFNTLRRKTRKPAARRS
ncbi:MAG: hypothetical protein ACREXK_04625 [Gammaproteobacteria bacterium]